MARVDWILVAWAVAHAKLRIPIDMREFELADAATWMLPVSQISLCLQISQRAPIDGVPPFEVIDALSFFEGSRSDPVSADRSFVLLEVEGRLEALEEGIS